MLKQRRHTSSHKDSPSLGLVIGGVQGPRVWVEDRGWSDFKWLGILAPWDDTGTVECLGIGATGSVCELLCLHVNLDVMVEPVTPLWK